MLRKFMLVLVIFIAFISQTSIALAEDKLIQDPNLEQAIQAALHLSGENLTQEDLNKLVSLYPRDTSKKISTLEGLQYASNLKSLYLPHLGVSDLSPIRNLTQLFILALNGNNISDIEPLRELKELKQVILSNNQITSLDALSNLTEITDLLLDNNQISDLSPLSGLNPKWLIVSHNNIDHLEAIQSMTNLRFLYLDHNQVHDIGVLEGLPNLKEVALEGNPLNEAAADVIKRLKQKGIVIREFDKEKTSIQVLLDAKAMEFDVPPFIQNGSTMVPFRTLFEKLGLTVEWQQETKTIIGTKVGLVIKLQIGNEQAEVNGASISMPVAPVIVSDQTFVPLRFISEATDCQVDWDQNRRTAVIRAKHLFQSKDGNVQVTAHGSWMQLTMDKEPDGQILAIRSFNYRYFMVRALEKSKVDSVESLTEYFDVMKKDILSDSRLELLDEKEAVYKGLPARQFTYRFPDMFRLTALCFETDTAYYTVIYGAIDEYYNDALPELSTMLNSLSLP